MMSWQKRDSKRKKKEKASKKMKRKNLKMEKALMMNQTQSPFLMTASSIPWQVLPFTLELLMPAITGLILALKEMAFEPIPINP